MQNRTIPFNAPAREAFRIRKKLESAVSAVLESGSYILGKRVGEFERTFAEYCGAVHCVSVANGTDALEIALRAIGCQRDSEVITAPNAGGYTTAACMAIGAIPVYVDVDSTTALINLDRVVANVSPRTCCVVATHLYGQLVNVPKLRKALDAAGHSSIRILEDCAQAHGARLDGKFAGTFGEVGTYSFYPTKNLGALGDGGAIITSDSEIADACKALRQYGWRDAKYAATIPYGRNSRLDEIQATVLLEKLPNLSARNEVRKEIASKFEKLVGAPTVTRTCGDAYVAHLFVFRSRSRQMFMDAFAERGVATGIHYPVLDPDQECMTSVAHRCDLIPVARDLVQHIVSIPCFPEMEADEIRRVEAALESCLHITG